MKELKGRVVLITGGGMGLGRLMALRFARAGSRVVLWDLNRRALTEALAEIRSQGGEALGFTCNVADRRAVERTARQVRRQVGPVDVLVNNAGIVSGKPFLECTAEQNLRTMQVNALSHFWTVRAFLPDMIEADRGHVVSIASAAGLIGVAGLADYCASKFAVVGFDEALRMELKKRRSAVTTTCVCPYYINTGMFAGVRSRFGWLLPILEPERVADAIVKAIRTNRRVLKMPRLVYLLPFLRLLPTAVLDFAARVIGISSSMDEFRGREA